MSKKKMQMELFFCSNIKINENTLFPQVTKLIGAEWSNLTVEQRAPYNNLSEQEKRRYKMELQAYRQRHHQAMTRKKRIKSAFLSKSRKKN